MKEAFFSLRERIVPLRLAFAFLLIACVAGFAKPVWAAAGEFDRSFGQNGIATFPTDAGSLAYFVTTDSGGNILATGKDRGIEFLMRSLADGTPDTAFNGVGYLRGVVNVPNSDGRLILGHTGQWVTNTTGGQILAARQNSSQCAPELCRFITPTIQLRRINRDGGALTTANADIAATVGVGESMQVIEDSLGGFLFVTQIQGLTSLQTFLARVGANGLRDTVFRTETCPSFSKPDNAYGSSTQALALAGGKTLLAHEIGLFNSANPFHVCVSRINADGTPDKTYAVNGDLLFDSILSTAVSHKPVGLFAAANGGSAVLLQEKIVRTPPDNSTAQRYLIVWLTAQGTLDTARQDRGVTGPTDLFIGQIVAAAMQRDGKFVLAGYPASAVAGANGDYTDRSQPRVVRLLPQGSGDFTFGPGGQGYASLVVFGKRLVPQQLHIAEDGSIFVAGGTVDAALTPASGEPTQFAVGKLQADPAPIQPAAAQSSGGGCGITTDARVDPVLPALALVAFLSLWIRRRNPA